MTSKEDLTGGADISRIVKLHGSFPSRRPFIVTSEDYRSYPQKFAPFVNTVQQSLLENTFCMIGFSGRDPNFEKWIGWIRDNLNENAPLVYLITHEKLPDAYTKFLYKRNVIAVNIASFGGNDISSKYETLFDYILKHVPDDKPSWPSQNYYSSIVGQEPEQQKNAKDTISKLKMMREQYLGWLIAPKNVRGMLRSIKHHLEDTVHSFAQDENADELEFLYEYDWIREKCLLPPFNTEIQAYNAVIDRHIINKDLTSEQKSHLMHLLISLLRDCRESGEFEQWQINYNKLEPLIDGAAHELLQRLSHESCMKSLFTYDYTALKSNLGNWVVQPQEHRWALYKGGLLCETDKLEEANRVLSASLERLRRQLQSDSKNIYLLSLESATMALIQHLSVAMKSPYGSEIEEPNSMEEEFYTLRRRIHQNIQVDFDEENSRFTSTLSGVYVPKQLNEIKPSFDFDMRTVTASFGENSALHEAISFLRFREETGHPFRIHNCVDGVKEAVAAAERIARMSVTWAVITLIRADAVKSLDNVITRSLLSSIPFETTNKLVLFYTEALIRSDEHLDSKNWLFLKDFVAFSASVLPAFLSRLCCKCSIEALDKILFLTLHIYCSEKRNCYKETRQLVIRLIESFPHEEKLMRVQTLFKFPYIAQNENPRLDFVDPMRFISMFTSSEKQIRFADSPLEGVDAVLKTAEDGGCDRLTAMGRLMILLGNGLLTNKQHEQLLNILEKGQYVLPNWFYPTVLLYINLPTEAVVRIKVLMRNAIIVKLNEEASTKTLKSGNTLLREYLSLAESGIFESKDIDKLIVVSDKLIDKFLHFIRRNSSFLSNADSSMNWICDICLSLTHLLIQNPTWTPNPESTVHINEIIKKLNDNQLSHPYLSICWTNKSEMPFDQSFILSDLISKNAQKQHGVMELLILSARYGDRLLLRADLKNQIMDLMCQRIMWRLQEKLESVIYAMNYVLSNEKTDLSEDLRKKLIIGLDHLYTETKITCDDSLETAQCKGEVRIAAIRLASTLYDYYCKQGRELPDGLCKWKSIPNDWEEFAEMRVI